MKSFIADKRKLNELIKVRKEKCAGCDIAFVEDNSIVAIHQTVKDTTITVQNA